MTVYLLTYDAAMTSARAFAHESLPEATDAKATLPGGLLGAIFGTADDVGSQFKGPQVLQLVNLMLPEGASPVKRFATPAAGAKRLFAMTVKRATDQAALTAIAAPAPQASTPTGQQNVNSGASADQPKGADMATKKKAAKKKAAKKTATPRKVAPLFIAIEGKGKPPADTTCGCYIRSLIMQGELTNADILGLVKKHYPESTAKGSDISWNRAKLSAAGKKVPAVVKPEKAE